MATVKKFDKVSLSDLMNEGVKNSKERLEIISLGEDAAPLIVSDVLSTGLKNLDRVLSVSVNGQWGLPVGRIISVKSKPSVGKTTFLLKIADQALKRGGAVHFVESEHALDLEYAKKITKRTNQILISQPDTLEEAFEVINSSINICRIARKKTESTAPFVIIVDSFSGFTTEAESEKSFTSGKMGALGEHARIASLACRKLTGPLAKAKAILLLSHQTKSKIGTFWGSNETNIGGDAFNYHDSICLSLYRSAAIKDKAGIIVGHYGIIKTSKNKLFPPHRQIKMKVINGKGISSNFALLDFLITEGIILKKPGGVFIFKDDQNLKWRGLENFSPFLKSSKKARLFIKRSIDGI